MEDTLYFFPLCSFDKLLFPCFSIFSFLIQLPIFSSVSQISKELCSSSSQSFHFRHFSFNVIMKKAISSQYMTNPKPLYRFLFCPSSSCTIICCINTFTSLCKNQFKLLEFLAEAFRCHVPCASTGTVKNGKLCTWHRKASAKNSSKLNKFLHSEVNQLIQHTIGLNLRVKISVNSGYFYEGLNRQGFC